MAGDRNREMELWCYFRLLLIASCILARTAAVYDTYYAEQDCQFGSLNISLTEGGPMSAALLRATERTYYSRGMDCKITITAPPFNRILVSVLQIGFRVEPTGNCIDYIKIHRIICENIFRLEEERHYFSADNTMEILYHVSNVGDLNNLKLPGMKLTVTAYKESRKCPSSNDTDWFLCNNDNCIWSGLKCDSHNNCGDLSDEQDCGGGGGNQSTVLIILGCLILLLMVIMCVATLLCSKNENIRRFSNRLRSRTLSYMPRFSK